MNSMWKSFTTLKSSIPYSGLHLNYYTFNEAISDSTLQRRSTTPFPYAHVNQSSIYINSNYYFSFYPFWPWAPQHLETRVNWQNLAEVNINDVQFWFMKQEALIINLLATIHLGTSEEVTSWPWKSSVYIQWFMLCWIFTPKLMQLFIKVTNIRIPIHKWQATMESVRPIN
jgi:hypothetical protein